MKKRKKHILSRSGVKYKVVLDDDKTQAQIIFIPSNKLFPQFFVSHRKKEIHKILKSKNLYLEMVTEDRGSVTYMCPRNQQRKLLRALAS